MNEIDGDLRGTFTQTLGVPELLPPVFSFRILNLPNELCADLAEQVKSTSCERMGPIRRKIKCHFGQMDPDSTRKSLIYLVELSGIEPLTSSLRIQGTTLDGETPDDAE